jgi:hypothetical protein
MTQRNGLAALKRAGFRSARTMTGGDSGHIGSVERQTSPMCLVCVGAVIGVVMAFLYWQYVLPDRIKMRVFCYIGLRGTVA